METWSAYLLFGQVLAVRFAVGIAHTIKRIDDAVGVTLRERKAKVERRLRRSRADLGIPRRDGLSKFMNAEGRRRERTCGGGPSEDKGQ